MADSPIAEAVPVEIQRGGEAKTISVTLGRRETDEALSLIHICTVLALERIGPDGNCGCRCGH